MTIAPLTAQHCEETASCLFDNLSTRAALVSSQSHLFSRLRLLLTGQAFLPDELDNPLLSNLQFKPQTASKCSFTSAEQRELITSLIFLSMHLLTQTRRLLALFAAKAPYCPPGALDPFWQSCSAASKSPAYPAEGISHPGSDSALILDEFGSSPVNIVPSPVSPSPSEQQP